MSFMLGPYGVVICKKCQGMGCYSCEKRGTIFFCPQCGGNTADEVEDKKYKCLSCGTFFDEKGDIQQREPPAPKKDAKKNAAPNQG